MIVKSAKASWGPFDHTVFTRSFPPREKTTFLLIFFHACTYNAVHVPLKEGRPPPRNSFDCCVPLLPRKFALIIAEIIYVLSHMNPFTLSANIFEGSCFSLYCMQAVNVIQEYSPAINGTAPALSPTKNKWFFGRNVLPQHMMCRQVAILRNGKRKMPPIACINAHIACIAIVMRLLFKFLPWGEKVIGAHLASNAVLCRRRRPSWAGPNYVGLAPAVAQSESPPRENRKYNSSPPFVAE